MTGYAATHAALRRTRGPASERACVECGRRAAVWRCRCNDSSVVVGVNSSGRRVTFSTDVAEYEPACWRHANAHDRERAARRRAEAHLAVTPRTPRQAPVPRIAVDRPEPEPLFTLEEP